MANERFKRTPTSSGNRSTHTWSGWIKRNVLGDWTRLFSTAGQTLLQLTGSSPPDQIRYLDQTGSNYDLRSTSLLRDVGSWMHIVLSVDHTLSVPRDRVRIYVNGAELDDYSTDSTSNGAQNLQTYFNSITEHALLGRETANTGENFKGEAFDVFWVDGQALTPDVFGFYKDGDGYMSSGSTNATDFRPGQWSPKSPSVIKNVINDSGGFGVNGFYLPMNDSSNNGADFHCDPNSIITLKGEDLPQPRNGAPTTSDAYVSQLRTDANAANLVLAVPGASTATGVNLVTNGHFDNGTTGWTISDASEGSMAVVNGQFVLTNNDTSDPPVYAYQLVTVEVGKRYTVGVDLVGGTASSIAYYLSYSNNPIANFASRPSNSGYGNRYISFTATSTTLYVILRVNANSVATAIFDNVVVKQENVPLDYSADIKGSGSNKTPTVSGNSGIGYELGNYYGSAYTSSSQNDYLEFPGTSGDFNVGTGDFTIEMWLNPDSTQPTNARLFGQTGNAAGNWDVYINSTAVSNQISMMGGGEILTGGNGSGYGNLVGDQWNHFCLERYSGQLTTYMNGVAVYTQSYTSSIGDSTNPFRVGQIGSTVYGGIGYGFNSDIQDFRIYKGVAKYKGGFDVPKPYTPVGIETFRTTADTCKNNFATLNALYLYGSANTSYSSNITLSDGNLTANWTSGTGSNQHARSNFAMLSGKWYFEMRMNALSGGDVGVAFEKHINDSVGYGSDQLGFSYRNDGKKQNNTSSSSYGASFTTGDIISVTYDADNGNIIFYKNGVSQGVAFSGITIDQPAYFSVGKASSGATQTSSVNFGQNPSFSGTTTAGTNADDSGKGLFKYAPPSGFLALCEDNLPTPAIADPGKHFKTVLYTGDGNTRSIPGVGFQPDLVWIKSRNAGLYHLLTDSVRGVDNTLSSNTTDNEAFSTERVLNSFDNDGFSLNVDDGSGYFGWNVDGQNMVAWCWKAGGAAVSNTDGSITSQVSANQDAGFSIVSYTGNGTNLATVGHGLNKEVKFMITKSRTTTDNWVVHTDATGTQTYSFLNTTTALTSDSITAPSSSVFYRGTSNTINGNTKTYISYCWAEIEGYSKFGSYIGNASTDGPFVYCGFKPAWVMIKVADTTTNGWVIMDNARSSSNPNGETLFANISDAEYTDINNRQIDFLSNGFKLRNGSGSERNTNGATYIFMAFAESPFQTANAK